MVPDARNFRSELDTQMKTQNAEFVLQVRADAAKAREEIADLRREEEARAVHVRVQSETGRATEQVDRMRAEQESRAMHIRVTADQSQIAGLSRAVENARDRVVASNEAIIASDRRVENSRRLLVNANDAIVASERRVDDARQAVEARQQRLASSERSLAELRNVQASEINPLLAAAENALERARQRGNPEGIARNERNLSEMRKALGAPTHDIERAEQGVAEARRQLSVATNRHAQAVDGVSRANRAAEQAERGIEQALDGSSAARRRAAQASRNLGDTVDDEIRKSRDLSRELGTLHKDFESAFQVAHFADAFSSVAPFIGMLPAAAVGVAELAGAMQQLAGAGLALPGMFAGAAVSLGTLLVGVHGVSEAYEALTRNAVASGEEQRQHAIEVRSANEELASATREESEAERERARAVRDSRQEMQDLNLELRGGQINTAEAILDAQKARRDLVTGHYKDGLDYQSAQLRIVRADQQVAESLNNQNRLRTRAADVGDHMAQADDRLANAHQRLARAQEHVNDVNIKVTASQRAVNTAMAMLGPNAQEFTKTIFELTRNGPLHELQVDTSQNLFAGMSTSVRTLVDSDLPTLKSGMGAVATSLNGDFKALFSSLGSDQTKGLLSRIFGDTSQAQDLLKNAINPLVSGVGTLARAGADTLPRMADGLGRAADRFDRFISAADKDGRLDGWINAGITGFTHLGDIVINLAQSVGSVTKALGGQGLLASLDDGTKKLNDFLKSAKGQDDLRRVFAEGRHELEQIRPILEALPGIMKGVFAAGRDYVEGWLPILQTVAGVLKSYPGLTEGILDGFLAWRGISPAFTFVGDGLTLMGKQLGGVQTQITNSRIRADSEMSTTSRIFQRVAGNEGVGKLSGVLTTLGGAAGPLAVLATVAIPALSIAFDAMNDKTRQAQEAAKQLDDQERTLEGTLDRVTGKITAATRNQAIDSAQHYDTTGAPGGGIPGISKGNALEAATKLGIAPDVYANALVGDSGAVSQVRDILAKNNLGPEFAANQNLQGMLKQVNNFAGQNVPQELLIRALLGNPDAVKQFNDLTAGANLDTKGLTLTDFAKQLSATGQASVLAGGNLNRSLSALPGAQSGQSLGQQAQYGRYKLSDTGRKDFGVGAADVRAADDGYHVQVPDIPPQLADTLKRLNITADQLPYGQGWTFLLPKGSPDVEKYEKGGGTPLATGPLPDGGYNAVIHPSEYIANKTGRQVLGDAFLGAANQGVVDPSLLPHFDNGGPGDQAPEFGPTDASSDQQEQQSGNLLSAFQAGISGLQNPINNAISFAQQMGSQDGSQDGNGGPGAGRFGGLLPHFSDGGPGDGVSVNPVGSRLIGMPGVFGLAGAAMSPDPGAAFQAWGGQTMNWLAKWGINTATQAAGIAYQGGLGFFGLDKSVLSPSNQWTRAGMQATQGIMNRFGAGQAANVLGAFGGGGGDGISNLLMGLINGGANPQVGQFLQSGQLDPSLAGSVMPDLAGAAGLGNAGGSAATPTGDMVMANPASRAAIQLGGTTTSAVQRAGLQPLYAPGTTFGYGQTPPAAARVPASILQLADQFGLEASTDPHGALHSAGFAFDFRPKGGDFSPAGRARMDAFSDFIKNNLSSQTLELIHYDPGTAAQQVGFDPSKGNYWGIAGAQDVDHPGDKYQGYFTGGDEGYSGHTDHVHWATDVPVILTPAGLAGAPGALGAPGAGMPGSTLPGGVNLAALGKGQNWWQGWAPGSASGPIKGASGMGSGELQNMAHALYLQAGMPAAEWSAFQQLISNESGWNPTAQNPGSTAFGLGQFLNSTWASVGGSKTSDPMQQLAYIFQYLKQRGDYHGSPAAALSLWEARSPHWYDSGGDWATGTVGLNMSGKTETVLTHDQTVDMHQALTTTADQINSANSRMAPTNPQVPDAQHMQPSPAQGPQAQGPQGPNALPETPQPTPAAPGGAPGGQPAPPAALGPLGPQAQQPAGAPTVHGAGPDKEQGAWGPDSGMHVAPALKTGITSAASAIGQAASTAIGIAGAGAGMFGGGALGAAGPYVAGLINEGGKIAVDVANIPSSLMVGTLSPGTTADPSGQTYHPQQEQRPVATSSTTNYGGFYGHNTDDVIDILDRRQAQAEQSHLANYRPR